VYKRQEHDLGIESASGSLFSEASIEASQNGSWQGMRLGRDYFAMIDPNFGGSDNFVMLVFDVTEDCNILVCEYAESDRSIEYSIGKCCEILQLYRIKMAAIESNSGGKIVYEDLLRKRPDIEWLLTLTTNASKKINTDRIALALEQREIAYAPGWQGMTEMRAYSAAEREGKGEKDDRVMALAAGWAHLEYAKQNCTSLVQAGTIRY
jgi:hypothetical protein